MKRWFHKSLQNKLTIIMLIVVILPIVLLGAFSYLTAIHLSKERETVSGQSTLQQLNTSLQFIINDVNNMSVFLIGNEDVQHYLKEEEFQVQQRRAIYGFLSNLTLSKPYIANILIEPINGNPKISTVPILSTERDLSTYRPQGKYWSSRFHNQTTLEEEEDVISLLRPIRSTENYELIGYLSIILDQKEIEDYLHTADLEWKSSILLMNEGLVLASNNHEIGSEKDLRAIYKLIENNPFKQSYTYKIAGEKNTVLTTTIPEVGWKLIEIIPFKEYSEPNRFLLFLTMAAVVIAVLIVSLLVLYFVKKVVGPISKLTKTLQMSNPHEGLKKLYYYSNDEVGQLINSYNKLNNRIEILMERVKKNEANKRLVDLQALQQQINPHFLYNTLASIHWMALASNERKISQMVSSLSHFLRFSLNKGNEYCTVEQELSHLLSYVQIQKIRYPSKFKLEVSVPEGVKQYMTLKLVLQPLVENSIVHGFLTDKVDQGLISVKGEWDHSNLELFIMDNGIGMQEEQVRLLHKQFKEDIENGTVAGKNYGLRNVNLRLYLHYGEIAQLQISSAPNMGTVIKTIIPLGKGEIRNETFNRR